MASINTILLATACFLSIVATPIVASPIFPVVLMHGIVNNAKSMLPVKEWIEEAHPDAYVTSIEIGNGSMDSVLWNMDRQVDEFCSKVKADPMLSNGFNAIGYSQGGLVLRGYIERCNTPPVHTAITWCSPHAGQFGIPEVDMQWLDRLLQRGPYHDIVQEHVSFSNYWRDPLDLQAYLNHVHFLVDINNEKDPINTTYRDNIASLTNFVLLNSDHDTVIHPNVSPHFAFFQEGSIDTIVPMEERDIYISDRIGLKILNESGRLHFFTDHCTHQEHPTEKCKQSFIDYTLPFLSIEPPTTPPTTIVNRLRGWLSGEF